VAAGQVVVVRRDTRRKEFVPLAELPNRLEALLAEIQQNLFARALAFREANTHTVDSFEEFKAIMEGQRGFLRAHWCGQTSCELAIKEQTGATLRCIPLHQTPEEGQCILCGEKSSERVLFARAY
jgi:prolyl-tRNA synthetase